MPRIAIVLLLFVGFAEASFAGFDLRLICKPDKVPKNTVFVPKAAEVQIDWDAGRARLKDNIIGETRTGWLFVDGIEKRRNHVFLGYSIKPTRRQTSRTTSGILRRSDIRHLYRINLETLRYNLRINAGVGTNHMVSVKGICRKRG